MEYFLLSQSEKLQKPIEIKALDPSKYNLNINQKQFEELENMIIGYFKNEDDMEMPDVLANPTFLISNSVKKIFNLYDSSIKFKAVQAFSSVIGDKLAPLFWLMMPPKEKCMHKDTKFYSNGMLEKLVLDEKKLEENDRDIFIVDGVSSSKVVISLAVAESLLRRCFYGIGLEKIEVR